MTIVSSNTYQPLTKPYCDCMYLYWLFVVPILPVVQCNTEEYIHTTPSHIAKHAKRKYNQNQLILCVEVPVSELDTDDREIPTKTFEQTVT